MIRLLCSATVFLIIVFPNLPLFGLGPGSLFALISFLTALNRLNGVGGRSATPPQVRNLSLLVAIYATIVGLAFVIETGLNPVDIRYAASIAGLLLIFGALPQGQDLIGRKQVLGYKVGIRAGATGLCVVWLYSVLQTGNFFILRQGGTVRSAGLAFSNPNVTARLAFLTLCACLYLAESDKPQRRTYFTLGGLLSLVVISTVSRANLIALLVLFLSWILLVRRAGRSNRAIAVLVIATAVLYFAGSPVVARLAEVGDVSVSLDSNLRGRSYAASLEIVRENPWFGVARSGEFEAMRSAGSVSSAGGTTKVVVTHGGFLKAAVYAGIPASLALMSILAVCLRWFWMMRRRAPVDSSASAAAALGVSLCLALIPMNLGADGFGVALTWFVLGFLLAEASISQGAPGGINPLRELPPSAVTTVPSDVESCSAWKESTG